MHPSDLFRSFIPRQNPIGFNAADFLEFGWLLALVGLTLAWRPWIAPAIRRIAERTWLSMLLLAALPVLLRLALLPNHPAPYPEVYDESSHLLVADTLRHWRLANPMHPLHQFFETFFVLQQPVYASIYPLGQGLALALGRLLFGLPWAGVVLDTAVFCVLVYWMLCGWLSSVERGREWALLGGLLAVAEFGPLSYWMNSYWGGTLAAIAGCLVFGSLPRLRTWAPRNAAILGAGLGLHWLVRPFETLFLCLGVAIYLAVVLVRGKAWTPILRVVAIATLAALPAIALSMLHDKRVTGEWFKLPEMLSQEQYGIPAALTFQKNPVPHRALTPEQDMEYKMQMSFKGVPVETLGSYARRFEYRARFYRFFYMTPLYVVLPLFLLALAADWELAWVAGMLAIFALGTNFFPAYQHHYFGGVACLFLLVSVVSLHKLWIFRQDAARLVILFCAVHFAFWYSVHLFDTTEVAQALRPYETWPGINHRLPTQRSAVREQIAGIPGQLLVFVKYYRPQHVFQDEWVYNEADIDASRVVWARDLGDEENQKLIQYYPHRSVWMLEPEYRPARLRPYAKPTVPMTPVESSPGPAETPGTKKAPEPMRLLPVPQAKSP